MPHIVKKARQEQIFTLNKGPDPDINHSVLFTKTLSGLHIKSEKILTSDNFKRKVLNVRK